MNARIETWRTVIWWVPILAPVAMVVQLGGDPSALPAPLGMEPVDEALAARLRQLKDLGKL